ncbi:glycosyl transferase [Bacteroidia bacterium]|nr:glycosyl transferase [Bacteroidia bacterium]
MRLSIITINYNNAAGLQKTMQSVLNQISKEFEYIVVDGGSTDGSVEIITNYELTSTTLSHQSLSAVEMRWVSEKDNGIYHAMNKGIKMAKGEYVQFLNSGDCLASDDVTARMLKELPNDCAIFYGNMLKLQPYGILRDKCFAGRQPTMLDFYRGTLNHSPAYIRRSLFDKYGLYDESLKIVSDWKFYLQAIIFGKEYLVYQNIDVTLFDMTGVSETNKELDKAERLQVLKELLPERILQDYQIWSFPISQMQRIKCYPFVEKLYYFIERVLFKIDKNKIRKKKEIICFP